MDKDRRRSRWERKSKYRKRNKKRCDRKAKVIKERFAKEKYLEESETHEIS